MRIERVGDTLALLVRQRCLPLFVALLLLLVAVPILEGTPRERVVLNAVNVLILVTATAAVARSRRALVIAFLLAAPAVVLQALGFILRDGGYLLLSQAFGAGFYVVVVAYLLAYVMRHEVLTPDKLYGAAATYLMLGILWSYLYTIVLAFHPGALVAGGDPVAGPPVSELLYFSFTVLTTTGFGEITPVHPVIRMLCVLEQIIGLLYVGILIARLAGTYTPGAEA